MSARILSFFRPAVGLQDDWSQQELAEFYRVEAATIQAGLSIVTDRGLSDEGDPWFVFCRAQDERVFLHIARIGGLYWIAGDGIEGVLRGPNFRALLIELTRTHPTFLPIPPQDGKGKVLLHPGALLAAIVATACLFAMPSEALARDATLTDDSTASFHAAEDCLVLPERAETTHQLVHNLQAEPIDTSDSERRATMANLVFLAASLALAMPEISHVQSLVISTQFLNGISQISNNMKAPEINFNNGQKESYIDFVKKTSHLEHVKHGTEIFILGSQTEFVASGGLSTINSNRQLGSVAVATSLDGIAANIGEIDLRIRHTHGEITPTHFIRSAEATTLAVVLARSNAGQADGGQDALKQGAGHLQGGNLSSSENVLEVQDVGSMAKPTVAAPTANVATTHDPLNPVRSTNAALMPSEPSASEPAKAAGSKIIAFGSGASEVLINALSKMPEVGIPAITSAKISLDTFSAGTGFDAQYNLTKISDGLTSFNQSFIRKFGLFSAETAIQSPTTSHKFVFSDGYDDAKMSVGLSSAPNTIYSFLPPVSSVDIKEKPESSVDIKLNSHDLNAALRSDSTQSSLASEIDVTSGKPSPPDKFGAMLALNNELVPSGTLKQSKDARAIDAVQLGIINSFIANASQLDAIFVDKTILLFETARKPGSSAHVTVWDLGDGSRLEIVGLNNVIPHQTDIEVYM